MRERGIGEKVFSQSRLLDIWAALSERLDNAANFLDYTL
jgi:hypothetical protein